MAKDYARAFYDSPAWRRTREAYLQSKHYICEDCGGAASVVHHITYIKPWNVNNPEITLNWDNLKAVRKVPCTGTRAGFDEAWRRSKAERDCL